MQIKTIIGSILTVGLLAGGLTACCTDKGECKEKKENQAKLEAQAKVSKADAEKIALAKAPGGSIKEGEIEKEHGKLVWSFDITTPDSKDITEVNVDAMTGDVVGVEKEKAEDSKEEKGKKDKD